MGVKSTHKQAGCLVAEHGSREALKSQGGAHYSLDFSTTANKSKQGGAHSGSAASETPGAFLAMGGGQRTATATVDPASEQWPIVVLTPLSPSDSQLQEYSLLASGRHAVEDRAPTHHSCGATPEGALEKQKEDVSDDSASTKQNSYKHISGAQATGVTVTVASIKHSLMDTRGDPALSNAPHRGKGEFY